MTRCLPSTFRLCWCIVDRFPCSLMHIIRGRLSSGWQISCLRFTGLPVRTHRAPLHETPPLCRWVIRAVCSASVNRVVTEWGGNCPRHHTACFLCPWEQRPSLPHYGGSTRLWNIGLLQRDYTALYASRMASSLQKTSLWPLKQRCLRPTATHLAGPNSSLFRAHILDHDMFPDVFCSSSVIAVADFIYRPFLHFILPVNFPPRMTWKSVAANTHSY
jgi:hypothetical protein